MRRRGFSVLCAISLTLCLVTVVAWVRGLSGRPLILRQHTNTVLRAWILDSTVARYECLSEPTGKMMPLIIGSSASDTPLMVAKDYRIGLRKGFAREGVGAYVWCDWSDFFPTRISQLVVSYWSIVVLTAIAPTVWLVLRLRRRLAPSRGFAVTNHNGSSD
jgi:hypothetical protein